MPVRVPTIPATIETAEDAREAVRSYLQWRTTPTLRMISFDSEIQATFKATHDLLIELDAHAGPGPVVRIHRAGDDPVIIGRPKVPTGRSVFTLNLPAIGFLAPAPPESRTSVVVLGADLAKVAAGVAVAYALAARAATCADTETDLGHSRESGHFREEATALERLGEQLESAIPVIGAQFLDDWRSQAAARGVGAPPPPAVKPINLR